MPSRLHPTCGSRLFGLFDLDISIKDAPDAKPLEINEGTLPFNNVSFAYPAAEYRNISFEARRGETIAIVGPPGSGKSTLAHLIARFHDVIGGAITIDGQDIRTVTLATLRKAVAVVQQDAFLFTNPLWRFLGQGTADRSRQPIRPAPQLYSRPARGLQNRGARTRVSLSGGQRQRLTIARTMMLQPPVIVFDDSSAAIDTATEGRKRSAMRRFAKDRVTIIIAHRLSSLMNADQSRFFERRDRRARHP